MKKYNKFYTVAILSILIKMFIVSFVFAQSPQLFNYQAIMHNVTGEVITSKLVGLRISILKNSTPVCIEEFKSITNPYGMVALQIGSVNTTDFAAIDWSSGTFSIKIEVDKDGGTSYSDIGTTQLLSVPFAMYAKKAGNAFSGNYSDLSGKPDLGVYLKTEVDGSVTNEIELPANAAAGDMVYFNGTTWAKIEKPTDPNFKYTLEWDFNNNKPYWKFKLPSVTYNGTTLYIHPTDNNSGIRWYNGDYLSTNARSAMDGEANTSMIVSIQGTGSYAAKVCSDLVAFGYDDWYLPAKDELNAIYNDKEAIGGFSPAYYWTSTEFSTTEAWGQDFNNGSQVIYGKYPTSRCRCVRK